jgi:hypothetical protein
MNLGYKEYYKHRNFVFVGIKTVHCHNVIRHNETYVCLGVINFYKYRQMVASGRIYKVPKGLDIQEYFRDFTEDRLRNYDLDERFILCTELHDILGKGIKNELLEAAQ